MCYLSSLSVAFTAFLHFSDQSDPVINLILQGYFGLGQGQDDLKEEVQALESHYVVVCFNH